jgi:hypothetical protein
METVGFILIIVTVQSLAPSLETIILPVGGLFGEPPMIPPNHAYNTDSFETKIADKPVTARNAYIVKPIP